MQILKTCTRCNRTLGLDAFSRRAASRDGLQAACRECSLRQKHIDYWGDEDQNRKQRSRSVKNRRARLQDPAYKRAFYLWGSTKRRTKIPPWVCIADFLPICAKALALGADFEIDHIIPLKGKLVSGLHVPGNVRVVHKQINQGKSNKFPAHNI